MLIIHQAPTVSDSDVETVLEVMTMQGHLASQLFTQQGENLFVLHESSVKIMQRLLDRRLLRIIISFVYDEETSNDDVERYMYHHS